MALFGLRKRAKTPAELLDQPVVRELPTPPEPETDRVSTSPLSGEQLLQLLFDAAVSGDESRLRSLCRDHHDAISEHAPGWLTIPDAIRANAGAAEWYVHGVEHLIRVCTSDLATLRSHAPSPVS